MGQTLKQSSLKFRAGFIAPMLCLAVKELPEGTGWAYELKLDGYWPAPRKLRRNEVESVA